MTKANPDSAAASPPPLTDLDEQLFRQVPPAWIDDGEPSSQAFRPTRKDDGQLSISLGSLTTAEAAFIHHTTVLKYASAGTWAITVGEVTEVKLLAFPDALPDSPAHGYVDFAGLSNGDCERRSKVLLAKARARGRLHP